jgi:hypothetical protein
MFADKRLNIERCRVFTGQRRSLPLELNVKSISLTLAKSPFQGYHKDILTPVLA